jgi:orotate phosphoribosyltransferase
MTAFASREMSPEHVLALLERRGALLSGHFRLSSGLHSDRFIQKFRIFEDPPTAEAVCGALAERLRPARAEVVVSAAVGGIIPGYVIAKALGVRDIFVEKEGGVPVLRRGFAIAPGERVAVVEDVMTTGRSTVEVVRVVQAAGGDVVAIGAVVKRGKPDLPVPVTALLDLPLKDFAPDECPLCRQGVALQDPGSRRTA